MQTTRQTIGHLIGHTWRKSLSLAPLIASLLVILALALFIGLFWAVNEYLSYRSSIDNITSNYNRQYQQRVREELEKVIDFIEYKRVQSEMQIEDDLRDKVQSAYSIASHMYSLNNDSHSVDEMRESVKEVLRPIRWNNGRGYYFTGRIQQKRMELFSEEPYWEGKGEGEFFDNSGRPVIEEMIAILDEKGAGIYQYDLLKPAFPGQSFSKISFIKNFIPFDWFIGAGIYTDDLERVLQEDVLERISRIRFGDDGDVLGFREDGTIIISSDERLIGRSVRDLTDYRGFLYGQRLLEIGTGSPDEGYVQYTVGQENADSVHQRLSYVKAYPEWGWILSAGMYMDEMERAIELETATYQTISFRNVWVFITMFILAVLLMLSFAYVYSKKIEAGIMMFTDFFRAAADRKVKIQKDELTFSEFETIGTLANAMVDDRIQKELALRRNELRLDTLLQLGMMESHNLQEKYDFTLQRLVEITGSEAGYLALVNTHQTYLTICSYAHAEGMEGGVDPDGQEASQAVEEAGLAGRAVREGEPVMHNKPHPGNAFPYNHRLQNHLDIPVYDSDRIVLVGGVCNKPEPFDNGDIRQVSMLLEGLWLHVLKTCSEKELVNLERQVIAISQKERNRIGQDLHDGLCSHLSGVELLGKALQQKLESKSAEEAVQLGIIRELIKEGVEKAGQLARGLYPVHVIEQGLEAAIEELIAELQSAYRVRCSLLFENPPQWVDTNIQTHIYYILREAAFNGARHGKAGTLAFFLVNESEKLRVAIRDDGVGFQEASAQKGMGLHTMKYRAKAIGTELTIESAIDAGTSVTLIIEAGSYV
jgi:signal transduction histidine kinase